MTNSTIDPDGAAILARRQRFIALALGGLASGCAVEPGGTEEGITTTTAAATSTSTSESETGETSETATTRPQPCLSIDFQGVNDCDPFLQDCPEGEKCVPYGSTGAAWDANKCVQVIGAGTVGEACDYSGTADASDDCDADTHCWNAQLVEGVLTGVCTAFCGGSSDDPTCDAGSSCLIANSGSIALCLTACDPLLQDCEGELGCVWTAAGFGCQLTSVNGAPGEACSYTNDCAPGSVCLDAAAVLGCAGAACCAEYCALDEVDGCPDPQLECAAMFGEGQSPAGSEQVGLCVPAGACEGGAPGCLEHPAAPLVDD